MFNLFASEKKGAKAVTYKADDSKQVVYDGLNIVSLPKILFFPFGLSRFYVALYYGEKFSWLQDPKGSSAAGGGGAGLVFNQGEMLIFLGTLKNSINIVINNFG